MLWLYLYSVTNYLNTYKMKNLLKFISIFILFNSIFASLLSGEESFIPKPPSLNATNYILIDSVTGRVLAENGSDERIEPASITKVMTGFVAADQIAKGFVSLEDEVLISENCWRKGGSKMFIREGTRVLFSDLMKGMVIQSGNDASCAIAEHVAISEEGFDGFYHGWVASDLVKKLNLIGGNHTSKDFSNAIAEWVEPINGKYRNINIHECPPNGQGLVALIILAILEKFNFNKMSKADYIHIFCEATKIGYFLRDLYLADAEYNKLSVDYFLNSKIIDQYASKIDMNKAKTFKKSDFPNHPDTIYLTIRDKSGMTI